ncbi:MAG: grasp-with-spasm system ATP-grasp peptide maturase [Bacteroidales bacterium]|nr:grasp-with-spasm system ATP-grasp peptide maturase [Bacteroidales bacterium]MDD4684446.1 grasp-with-spasm system ATP-grasp peptide maturase [Bacteroidales bacterium]
MNKILILSNDNDYSTTKVIRWMNYIDNSIEVIRFDILDIENLNQIGISSYMQINNSLSFYTNDICVVWTRKLSDLIIDDTIIDANMLTENKNNIVKNLKEEFDTIIEFLYFQIERSNSYWLNKPKYNYPNKLEQLYIAKQLGFNTPNTIISTNKNNVQEFSNLITKSLRSGIRYNIKGEIYSSYTSRLKKELLANDFFISLFQEEIEKELELRVFYLDGKCYTIAILSQNNKQTEVDYRQYDHSNANRNELYNLPNELEDLIVKFMDRMNLQTGSLDFILNRKGDYIFLEVNPSGQYDIFNKCNIYPDKLIAEHLIKKYYEYKR